jgi:hypothetical protein
MAPLVAVAVAKSSRSRNNPAAGISALALGWNLFGFLDLIVAVGMGTGLLLRVTRPDLGTVDPASAMTLFPLVLIPTFAVPLGFILHIYSIWRTLLDRRTARGRLEEIRGEPVRPARARA